ncbi:MULTISPECIES: CU044_5270 family protein [Nonomuraea]|uniref:CU044_5270 family protein n=1 Tax=Nonomuraea ferruginea TaxID=46174 RepID=A0ABT4SWJ6_9ACTN|nr:CU044_5270 family protein [Nonomuraea ferruginea]MDA0641343.1 CU044_5270 family protein [Nonomuraea ferruginea]
MDDLRSLREWRAEVPEPDQEWSIPQRRRLLTRIRRRRWTWAHRLITVGAAGAAVAVLAVVALPSEPSVTEPAVTPSSAVRLDPGLVLAQAAKVASERGDAPRPAPTQWHYTRSMDKQPTSDTAQTYERWIRYDGKQTAGFGENGDLVVTDVPPDPGDDDLAPGQYDAKLRGLPTDPRKLLAKVTGDRHWIDFPQEKGVPRNAEPPDARAYRVITLYLSRYGTMPPRLEAAMFQALALIPGVRIEHGVTDAAGRAGLGIWREGGGDVRRYDILDPDTYRYLGTATVWLRDSRLPKGAVWRTALLSSVIVDRPGERG